jgi:hypothetical protein
MLAGILCHVPVLHFDPKNPPNEKSNNLSRSKLFDTDESSHPKTGMRRPISSASS